MLVLALNFSRGDATDRAGGSAACPGEQHPGA
jgi:hypothetical protein